MGRSAKMVRCTAFEKQKRESKGQTWKPSTASTDRAKEKVMRREEKEEKIAKLKAAEVTKSGQQKELAQGLASLGVNVAGGQASGATFGFIPLGAAAASFAAGSADMDTDDKPKPAKGKKK